MTLTVRRCAPEETTTFIRVVNDAFSGFFPDDSERRMRLLQGALTHGAFDGPQMVGAAGAYDFTVSIPGGDVKAGGVTMVGVLPTHRRRGALSRLMQAQLHDVHEWKRPIAMLFASEGAIYPRFGYGLASLQLELRAERNLIRWLTPAPRVSYRTVDHAEALEVLPAIHERARSLRPGMPARSRDWWEIRRLMDDEWARDGAGPLYRMVVADSTGSDVGYALYRVKLDWEEGVAKGRLEVVEALAMTREGEEAAWRYLFGVDLVHQVHTYFQPPDSLLLLATSEPVRLHAGVQDALWLRVVDVESALSQRAYAHAGRVVLEVVDDMCPWNNGRWLLDTGGDTATVARTEDDPDLVMACDALGSAYLGGFTFGHLVRSGRTHEARPGAASLADRMFRVDAAPWCPEIF